jgi:2-aminoadipate transaminase
MIEEAARRRLGPGNDPLVLQYGAAQGYLGFREALAEFLRGQTGLEARPDMLAATGSISSGLGMIAQVLACPGDRVACGDPTYFLARGILESARLRLVGIPVDQRGLDVDALASALQGGLEIAFAYVIPSFHNPCAVTLDPQRAERLVQLAEQHDFVVVADEPYPMLHFGRRPASMMSYDRGRGRVLGLGSFSKILGPGLRLGWVHAAPALIERFLEHGVLRSGGGLNPVISSIVHDTMQSGALAAHVEVLRDALRRRARALTEALDTHLPDLEYVAPEGGYFVWGRLPGNIDTTDLLEHARSNHAVGFTPGRRCAVERDLSAYLRLSFSFYDAAELDQAVRRLAAAVESSPSCELTPPTMT